MIIRITFEPAQAISNKPRTHSTFIRFSQYVEAALRRIVSLSQDARGPPGTYVLTSVPKTSRIGRLLQAVSGVTKFHVNSVTHSPFARGGPPHSRTSPSTPATAS